MNKSEWLWVAIRIFGVFLLVMAIVEIPNAVSSFWFADSHADIASFYNEENASKLATKIYNTLMAQGFTAVIKVVIYTLFGLYFACRGKLLHKILCREHQSHDRPVPSDS